MNLFQKKHDWILGGFEFLRADNVEASAGSGGATFATDDIAGVHYPRSKVVWGADGSVNDTSAAAPLPVVQTGTPGLPTGASTAAKQPALGTAGTASADVITVQGVASMTAIQVADNGGSITVDAASLPLPTGAATAAKQPALGTAGTAAADVITIQGVASMTAVAVSDNGGSLTVDAASLPLPTGAATSAKQDTEIASLATLAGAVAGTEMQVDVLTLPNVTLAAGTNTNEVVGDAAHDAVAAGNPLLMGGYASAAAPTAVSTDGDAVRAWHLLNGAQATVITAAGALIPGDATNGLDVDVTRMAALVAGTAIIGKVGIDQTTPGTTNLVALAANQSVNVAQINGVTALMGNGATGTGSQRVTIASDNTAFSVNATAVGQAAHDAAIAGSPVRTAARAMSADYTAVASGDTADILASLLGKQVVIADALPANTWSYAAAAGGLVNTTGVTAKAAAGAGIRNYVSKAQIMNSHQTIGSEIVIRDGAAGTVLWRGWAQFTGGGAEVEFKPPLRGTANTLIEIAEVTTTATAGVLVNLQGFVAAE